MATRNYNNTTGAGALTAPVSPSDTFLIVTDFTNYPAVPFTITLERGQVSEEVVLCTAINSTTLTVTRGFNGTAATTHLAGSTVEHTAVALDFSEANAHVNATANVHGIVGGLVGDEAPQTLLDKTLISPVVEADVAAGDAIVAYVPEGAEVRNLFRGMDPNGDDVFVVDSTGHVSGAAGTAPEHLVRKSQLDSEATTRTDADTALSGRVTANEDTLNAATAAATAGAIAKRDVAGRLAIAAPVATGDAATKGYADALGTAAATASTIVRRDAAGRFAAASPAAVGDVATKGYVDAQHASLPGRIAIGGGNINVSTGQAAVTQAIAFGVTFPGVPRVFITMADSGNDYHWAPWAQAVTTTGFTLRLYSTIGAPTTAPVSFNWLAVL